MHFLLTSINLVVTNISQVKYIILTSFNRFQFCYSTNNFCLLKVRVLTQSQESRYIRNKISCEYYSEKQFVFGSFFFSTSYAGKITLLFEFENQTPVFILFFLFLFL